MDDNVTFAAVSELVRREERPVAFVVVVSNEEFVDGAMTFAWSLHNTSRLVQQGLAKLGVIVPGGALSEDTYSRLRRVGWHNMHVVHDLTTEAPKAAWAPTFNKLYLFNLTEYCRVAYFDVDMLMLNNPDAVFRTALPSDRHIGALGNGPRHGRPAYFQTGMMLIAPTVESFTAMMRDFHTNPYHKTVNGRDGAIVRAFYKDRFVNIDPRLSAHLGVEEPLEAATVIGFHYRGDWKPWFNREKPPVGKKQKGTTKTLRPEMGPAYGLWWAMYEDMHRVALVPYDTHAPSADQPTGYNASRSLWLMRHTRESYVQPTSEIQLLERSYRPQELRVTVGKEGENCHDVCKQIGASCNSKFFSLSRVNGCDALREKRVCRTCSTAPVAAEYLPAVTGESECRVNSFWDKPRRPFCNATSTSSRRVCPCST